MELLLFIIVVRTFRPSYAYEIEWCSDDLDCENGEGDTISNAMCTYDEDIETETRGKCTEQKDVFKNAPAEYLRWLAIHNTFRDLVAAGKVPRFPKAANMKQMVWNKDHADQARRWSFLCENSYDPCLFYPELPNGVVNLQQLYEVANEDNITQLEIFEQYIAFYERFDVSQIKKFSSNESLAADFGTLVYSECRYIGAAFMNFKREGVPYSLIRSYYRPDFKIGERLYEEGEPCSKCPSGYKCNKKSAYKNLCAQKNDPTDGEYVKGLPGGPSSSPQVLVSSLVFSATFLMLFENSFSMEI